MQKSDWQRALNDEKAASLLKRLYGSEAEAGRRRIEALLEQVPEDKELYLFSTPGRTELAGNHTDHNHGQVLAASIHLDALALVFPRNDRRIVLRSAGFEGEFSVDLGRLEANPAEEGDFRSLIRGVAAGLSEAGYVIGGFEGIIESRVLPGSGLSSSAAVEVLLGTIHSHLYNDGSIAPLKLAQIGQYAENRFFGKPCGLMDQTACAVGGIIRIDFKNPADPEVERMEYSFEEKGYRLAVVDTGGNHADLTPDYAACPQEMFAVSRELGKENARQIDPEALIDAIPRLRRECGDRAILRVFHFLHENERVGRMANDLKQDDLPSYLAHMRDSGDSSWKLLQNCFTVQNPAEQGITLGITAAESSVTDDAAFRVHGGGFAGTIQALVSDADAGAFTKRMEAVFFPGCVTFLRLRQEGTIRISLEQAD